MKNIVLGGGCFWCTEAVFNRVKGVQKVKAGYAGGVTRNPSYQSVSTGTTGHAEVIRVEYEPKVISLRKILEIFFEIHDPTSINRQGNDIGSQYKSIILYEDQGDKELIDEVISQLNYDRPVVTEVKKLDNFYQAEDFHNNYYDNNKIQPYCSIVIGPKIKHFEQKFKEWIRT